MKRSLEVSEKGLPEGSLQIYMSLGYLSALALARQDWPSALAYMRRATSILIKLGERETAGRPSVARGEIAENSNFLRLHVLAAHRSANPHWSPPAVEGQDQAKFLASRLGVGRTTAVRAELRSSLSREHDSRVSEVTDYLQSAEFHALEE